MKDKFRIFMLMPFKDNLTKIYEDFIKKPLEDLGHRISRADDIFRSTPIMEDVINSIKRADIIIADLTGKNANVFYELGRAHEQNKYVIQISQDSKIPFDTSHIRTIIYRDNPEGHIELTENIKKYLESIEIEITVNKILDKLENSWDYSDAINNTNWLSQYEDNLLEYQVSRLRDIIDKNDQVSGSYAIDILDRIIAKYKGIRKGQFNS